MGSFKVEYRVSAEDEWEEASVLRYNTQEEAEGRFRIGDYDYRIIREWEEEVVKEYIRGQVKTASEFVVGKYYAHISAPEKFLYKVVWEFEAGMVLLNYDDPSDGHNVSLKYWPDSARYFIQKD